MFSQYVFGFDDVGLLQFAKVIGQASSYGGISIIPQFRMIGSIVVHYGAKARVLVFISSGIFDKVLDMHLGWQHDCSSSLN